MAQMDENENGLWIEGASPEAIRSIRSAFYHFQAEHNLGPDEWQIRVFSASGSGALQITVWIGQPPSPTVREPYVINDDGEAGGKVFSILQSLKNGSNSTPRPKFDDLAEVVVKIVPPVIVQQREQQDCEWMVTSSSTEDLYLTCNQPNSIPPLSIAKDDIQEFDTGTSILYLKSLYRWDGGKWTSNVIASSN